MAASEARVTRGKLLKRAGVGAAMIGAGSMVTAGTASAVGFCHDCSCGPCQGGDGCGHWAGHGQCTACVPTTEGCCFCHESILCGGATACGDSGDCPAGWACAATCCGGLICVPPAGDPSGICVDGINPTGAAMSAGGSGAHGGHHQAPAAPGHGHGL